MKLINLPTTTRRSLWKRLFIGYGIILLFLTSLAYAKLLPKFLEEIPNYDLYGHFFLLGILGILALKVFEWHIDLNGIMIAIAPILVSIFSISDEFFQKVSPNRTFSLLDMAANLVGIWVFYFVYRYYAPSRIDSNWTPTKGTV